MYVDKAWRRRRGGDHFWGVLGLQRSPGTVGASIISPLPPPSLYQPRAYSTTTSPTPKHLPHLTSTGEAHMVTVTTKPPTSRIATAAGRVTFSNPTPQTLIRTNALKKGDVLSVARIAGIMAVKKTPDIIPLCHPVLVSGVEVVVELGDGGVDIEATVECVGQTGVEMEALTAVVAAALTVVDMCKAVDRRMVVERVRVTRKVGGRSGEFVE